MVRTCAMSSAASTSRSRSGSVFTDSTGMPSDATRVSATAPSILLVILFRRSRNIARGSASDGSQIALEELHLARGQAARWRLAAGDEVRGGELRRTLAADGLQPAQRRLVLGIALKHLTEDLLGLADVPLTQVELAERRRSRL